MKTLIKALSTTALVLSAGCGHAAPQQPSKPAITAATQRQAVTVLLRELSGNQLGSGVLVGSSYGGHWVVTNRHVVQQQKTVCVVGSDRKAIVALVLPARGGNRGQELDLGLVWLPRNDKDALMVAQLAPQRLDASQLPLVIATGYPTPLQASLDGPPYSENEGLLLPLLKNPLEGGFDLAYTAAVQKGMSGGGVFVGGELIGINGAHANPLWPGVWRNQEGKAVDEQLNSKLEIVSLGISAEVIKAELKAAVVPGAEQLRSLSGVDCNTASNEATVRKPANSAW